MCTATYLPLPRGGFILTHSRDEKTARPAAYPPQAYLQGGQKLVYPKDPQGGGTWFATSTYLTVCLLNGAFVPHQPQPPYAHSRGLVPLQVFTYPTVDAFLDHYDPHGLEPFTLLMAEMGRFAEMRWDGRRMHIHDKDPDRPHIGSSVTLYDPQTIEQREDWFRQWLAQHPEPSVDAIHNFHYSGGQGNEANAIRMQRPGGLMTLSLTTVAHQDGIVTMLYDDFLTHQQAKQTLNTLDHAAA
jgi:hypothetical protein